MIVARTRGADPLTVLHTVEAQARATMNVAKGEVAPIVAAETPRGRTGEMQRALEPRIARTGLGIQLRVAAPRGRRHGEVTVAQVVRWVNRGTGLYREGPGPKRKIRAKNPLRRMTLPGGRRRWSVRGQHPNHFIDRIVLHGTPRVEAACREGAKAAGEAVARDFA